MHKRPHCTSPDLEVYFFTSSDVCRLLLF